MVRRKGHALKALAKSLGVKLELVATNPANRIPLLQSGKADIIVADITINPDRAQVIDFSTPYFVTGQQFLRRTVSRSAASDRTVSSSRISATGSRCSGSSPLSGESEWVSSSTRRPFSASA